MILDEYGPVRMIRDREWKLVLRYPYGPNELYCLENDPDEENNLYDAPSCEERILQMKKRLEGWFADYADPDLDGSRQPVAGSGQFDAVGKRAKGVDSFGPIPETVVCG